MVEKKKPTQKSAPKEKPAKVPRAKKPAPVKIDVHVKSASELAGHRIRKQFCGIVISDKMQKTIVVKVDRKVKHGFYKKFFTKSQNFKAHDEKNEAKIGDSVSIVETRPLSKDKRWALVEVLRKAVGGPAV